MERRRRGTIRAFSIACLVASVAVARSGLASQVPTPEQALNTAPVWMILIDDLHLDFKATGHIQQLLRTITTQLPQDGDLIAAASTGPSSITFDLTKERKGIEATIKAVSGAGLRPAEILDAAPGGISEVQYRAHLTFAAVYAAVAKLGRVASRRKALIYISNGYTVDLWPAAPRNDVNPFRANAGGVTDERLRAEVAELTQEAKRVNVTIFAINVDALLEQPLRDPRLKDPAGWENYRAATRRSLEVISEETGGFAIEDDLEGGLDRISGIIRQ